MQKIIINHFGPIDHCDIEIKDYMIFTGAQASGKSTLAKSIFFFSDIKNLFYQVIKRFYYQNLNKDTMPLSLGQRLKKEIRNRFLQIFGSTMAMDPEMCLVYYYDETRHIRIGLENRDEQYNYALIEISNEIWNSVRSIEKRLQSDTLPNILEWKKIIDIDIFHDESDIIYIPAGRSMITLLSSQINYLYSTMDDIQKRSIDYCTQNYLERILFLKQFFVTGYTQLLNDFKATTDRRIDLTILDEAKNLLNNILKGEYRNVDGEERLQVSKDHYVKINFASSGQQESVWILNVLFYYLLNNKAAVFIIEEPESHLFPDAQKLITEYISLAKNHSNRLVITTHSPYVLGSINNILFANHISEFVPKDALNKLISRSLWLPFEKTGAYYLENGMVQDCMDHEFKCINNEVIDGASESINGLYEQLVALKEKYAAQNRA